MRDPARIDRMIGLLRGLWVAYPDLRLGQIIDNAKVFALREQHLDGSPLPDTFYVEDDIIELGLRRLLNEQT
jgi:hypothetical protein